MSKTKWIGVLLFGLMTGGVGFILYFWWRYIKLCIKLDLFIAYLIIRVPILLVQLLLYYGLKMPGHKISHALHAGYTEVLRAKKSTGLIAGISFLVFMGLFGFSTSNLLEPGAWGARLVSLTLILVSTALLTLIIDILRYHFSDIQIARKDLEGTALAAAPAAAAGSVAGAAEGVKGAAQGVQNAAETAEQAKGVYDDIQTAGEALGGDGMAIGDIEGIMGGLLEDLGLESILGEGAAAAGGTALGPILLGILVLLIIAAVGIVFQAIIFVWFFMGFLQGVLGSVAGPIGEALGVGSAWADLFGQQAANRIIPGIGEIEAFEQTGAMVSQTAAKIGCIAKGPACFRQWQLNNTQRPGSEDVGEQYGLKIDRFEVGQGKDLDVAYKDANYAIPISFTLSNPRHGLKGLNAENVSYRMVVRDAEKTYCNTGWQPVEAFSIREPEEIENEKFSGNDIYPGTSASTGFQTIKDNENGDDFTLRGCKMLQPALGGYKTVMLEVRYNYFSQSTLYFQGMSLQNLQSNPSIEKSMKKSQTADTPVKASINVNSPVLYDQNELDSATGGDQSASQPFAVRASLDTEEYDLRYKVRELNVRNSQETVFYENEREECQFDDSGGDRILGLEPEARENLIDSEVDRDLWFTRSAKPPIFGCVMVLDNPRDISPTGETLTMGVEAEYTVALEQKIDGFKAYNSRCGARYNCPLLVTTYYNETLDKINYDNWMTKCKGVDAGNGCTVVKGPESESNWDKKPLTGGDKVDQKLEQGETAYDAVDMVRNDPGIIAGPALRKGDSMDSETYGLREVAVGLRERDYEQLVYSGDSGSGKSFVMYMPPRQEKDVELTEFSGICNNGEVTQEQKAEKVRNWMDRRARDFADVVAFRVKPTSEEC